MQCPKNQSILKWTTFWLSLSFNQVTLEDFIEAFHLNEPDHGCEIILT